MGEMLKKYVVYIKEYSNNKMAVGVTSNMRQEITRYENLNNGRNGNLSTKIVYYEIKIGIRSAYAREKELKSLKRAELISLVKSANPEMLDLNNIWKEDEAERQKI